MYLYTCIHPSQFTCSCDQIVIIGTCCWIIICRTKHAKKCFELKDATYATRASKASDKGEGTSLLSGEGIPDETREEVAAAVIYIYFI